MNNKSKFYYLAYYQHLSVPPAQVTITVLCPTIPHRGEMLYR